MAHKKGAGSTKNGRDSNPKKLGVKRFSGQWVLPGQILVRQRGTMFKPSLTSTQCGRDFTLYANKPGYILFKGRKVEVQPTKRLAGSVSDHLVGQFADLWMMG